MYWFTAKDIYRVLTEHGYLQGDEFIEPVKPGHGPCCTCQDCGYGHDECVCCHNELLGDLSKVLHWTRPKEKADLQERHTKLIAGLIELVGRWREEQDFFSPEASSTAYGECADDLKGLLTTLNKKANGE